MARPIEQIQQEIATLDQMVASTAEELFNHYDNYIQALGQAVKRQLILAAYHLCTQGYPDRFLQLSVSQRQALQQSLRKIGVEMHDRLLSLLHKPGTLKSLEPDAAPDAPSMSATEDGAGEGDEKEISTIALLQSESLTFNQDPPPAELLPLTPERLLHWQEKLEKGILETLRLASRESNQVLQQSDLLPQKLPETVLEAAIKTGVATEAAASPPNLLNLMIEAVSINERDGESEDAEEQSNYVSRETAIPLHIVAIHLRLHEIEFADATVMGWRSKIRALGSRLTALRREYQKKLNERAIAQAEAAWRSSWYEG